MPAIPDAVVEQVRQASDLVDVVGERVRLKKQGRRFLGLCPFHNEKTPSFNVVPDEGFYHCFGCLDASEPVWTRRGLVPISDVRVGDCVLGIGGLEERVTEVLPKRAPVLELHLASVRRDPLVLTPDHTCVVVREADAVRAVPMLYRDSARGVRFQSRKRAYRTPRGVRAVETRADAVAVGDYVLFPVVPDERRSADLLPAAEAAVAEPGTARMGPAPLRVAGLPVTPRTARMYGLWLAEGSVYRGGVRWSFHHDEQHLAAEVVGTLRDELGVAATVHVRPERTLCEVTCSNTHLSTLFPRWFGRGAAGKRVPYEALGWPVPVQNALLDAYLEGDGTTVAGGGGLATTISADLARGLYAVAVQARRPVSLLRGPHRTRAGNEIWALSLRVRESVDSFFHTSGGVTHYWGRVRATETLPGERNVVDINVTGTRTFTTRLGAVHNCKASGDVFRFVQETEGVGFLDAVRLLAERAGIEIAEAAPSEAASRAEAMHAALRFAAVFYARQLAEPAGERARAYLAQRGFTREAVRAFGIGVAPEGWDALARAALDAGYDLDTLEAVGLVKRREGGGAQAGAYDLFRDRLVFPILSPIGKVLGFGGRILPDSRQATADYTPAKYINTPETDVYRKAEVLFGMKQAKRDIRAAEEAIVVEGYADVVSLWQAGVRNVVAASGTALTAAQVDGLRRMDVRRLVLLFDADGAGQAAARKGVDVALDAGLAPYAVSLPDGADPDSFVRQFGADAFRRRLADARQDFVAFLADRARRAGLLATPEGKREAADDLVAALARLRDPILAEEYVRRAARALDVSEPDLRREVDRAARRDGGRRDAPAPAMRAVPAGPEAHPRLAAEAARAAGREVVVVVLRAEEEKLLLLMLREGTPMVEHVLSRMALDEFSEGPAREIAAALVAQYEAAGAVDKQPFLRGDHGDAVRALASRVLAPGHDLSERWQSKVGVTRPELDAEPFAVATDAMLGLKAARLSEAAEAAAVRLRAAEAAGADATPILAEIQLLQRLRVQVERGEFPEEA